MSEINTVGDLIDALQKFDSKILIYVEYQGPGGCDTCGAGGEMESDIERIVDLETKVILSVL